MKLDAPLVSYLQNILAIANQLKLDSIIVEPNLVRGVDEKITIFVVQDQNLPNIDVPAIGLVRLPLLMSRIGVVKTSNKFDIDATCHMNNEGKPAFVRTLTMKGEHSKVEYRCHNPDLIKSPRGSKQPSIYSCRMTEDAYQTMLKGQAAMKTDEVAFVGTKDGVFIEMVDSDGDKLTYNLADKVNIISTEEGISENFNHKYPIRHILSVFKMAPTAEFFISDRGILKMSTNDISVYILHKEE